jgi:hypothetical protein
MDITAARAAKIVRQDIFPRLATTCVGLLIEVRAAPLSQRPPARQHNNRGIDFKINWYMFRAWGGAGGRQYEYAVTL